jgi:hypothetical protein
MMIAYYLPCYDRVLRYPLRGKEILCFGTNYYKKMNFGDTPINNFERSI